MVHQSSENPIVYNLQYSHTMFVDWKNGGYFWQSSASEIVNEQTLEALAQPSMISDQPPYWVDTNCVWLSDASEIVNEQTLEVLAQSAFWSGEWDENASTILQEQTSEE
ncbi:hypothetical protein HD554DRAFT_2178076 [Boletus coccyginus]|nr:hypothetical protein HD554DRAFT_2178076 [Boletus coccyginus]